MVGWNFVEMGAGSGWLIFNSGPSEFGVHPTSGEWEGHTFSHPKHHAVSLICDDLDQTVAELKAKGATFSTEIADEGWGRHLMLEVPDAGEMVLYEPSYPTAFAR